MAASGEMGNQEEETKDGKTKLGIPFLNLKNLDPRIM